MFNFYNSNLNNVLKKYEEGAEISDIGICRGNVYANEDNKYRVYNFELGKEEEEEENKIKIQGFFDDNLVEGQTYKIQGEVIVYKGEKQIKVKKYYISKPVNKKGIIAYLQTLHGLKKKAELIYDEFGDDSINVLLRDPMTVANAIKGIGKKSVSKWQNQLKEFEDSQDIKMRLLGHYGLNEKTANKLIKEFGSDIINLLDKNPYMLIKKVKGYGFLKCDEIALKSGILPDNENRIMASIIYVLEDSSVEGHCYLPLDILLDKVRLLLSLKLQYKEMVYLYDKYKSNEGVKIERYDRTYAFKISKLKESIDNYNNEKNPFEKSKYRFIYHDIDECNISNQINNLIALNEIKKDKDKIYLKKLYFAEKQFAENIKRLGVFKNETKRSVIEKLLNDICKEKNYQLEEKQREACIEFNLSQSGVYILDGSAGTGKTFTLNLIIEISKRLYGLKEHDIIAVAPTGKASKVASKSIKMPCTTIHRALEYNPSCIGGFTKDEYNPFYENLVVCDETSMLDIEIANAFSKAIETGSKLIMMGDIKQLASVGAGNVLKDLIESSRANGNKGYVKVVTLNVIKRQGLLSGIVKNANNIIENKMIKTSLETKDFYVQNKEAPEEVRGCVINSIRRILTFPNYSLNDIQVLIPQKNGVLGVYLFNYIIQREFNPYKEGLRVFKSSFEVYVKNVAQKIDLFIQKGDKVIHTKNNPTMPTYSKGYGGSFIKNTNIVGVMNGETGVVEDIIKEKGQMRVIVKYDDFYVFYDDGIDEIELSYATTIHKSQGSAWKAVIVVVVPQHSFTLSNNLLYTGVTRAREFCTVIGGLKSMHLAISTHKDYDRFTSLQERLSY